MRIIGSVVGAIFLVLLCLSAVSAQEISAYPMVVCPGQLIMVTYSGAPGYYNDWISIYNASAPNDEHGGWYILHGQTSGTLSFVAPSEPGLYDFRLFENWPDGGYTDLARSNVVLVSSSCSGPIPTPVPTDNGCAFVSCDDMDKPTGIYSVGDTVSVNLSIRSLVPNPDRFYIFYGYFDPIPTYQVISFQVADLDPDDWYNITAKIKITDQFNDGQYYFFLAAYALGAKCQEMHERPFFVTSAPMAASLGDERFYREGTAGEQSYASCKSCGLKHTESSDQCLYVNCSLDKSDYSTGDTVSANISVKNTLAYEVESCLFYGYADEVPSGHPISAHIIHLSPGQWFNYTTRFKITDQFPKGTYVFWAGADDRLNTPCESIDTSQFTVDT